jgi:taurine dioxygenase
VAYTVEALSPELAFGRQVIGLRHEDLKSSAVREELLRMWVDDGLVVFRGSAVTPSFQIELSEIFGPLQVHPVPEVRHPEDERLTLLVSNPKGDDEDVIEVNGVVGCGWVPWHKDIVFTDRLNHGGILRATRIASSGGETGYLDQIDAYTRLSDEMKQRVEGLEVVYRFTQIDASPFYSSEKVRYLHVGKSIRSMYEHADERFPPVVHPLVFTQPETGRKALNYSPLFAQYVLDMDRAEGDALLRSLSDYLWSSPAYFHKWHPDEMVLWDNWRVLQRVTPAPYDEIRIVERTTITGDYGLGRKLGQVQAVTA